MRKLFCILILALTSTLAYAQRPDQIELPCPAGSSPTWMGQSYDQATGKYRQWQCVKQNGTVTQAITDSGNGGQVFNVKAYGAVADGVTNIGPALQAASTAAEAVTGTVLIPPGNYAYTAADLGSGAFTLDIEGTVICSGIVNVNGTSSCFALRSNQSIVSKVAGKIQLANGQGDWHRLIETDPGTSTPGTAATNVAVIGVQLDGNKANNTAPAVQDACIMLNGSTQILIRDNYIHDCNGDGISLESSLAVEPTQNFLITGNTINNVQRGGISIISGAWGVISHNQISMSVAFEAIHSEADSAGQVEHNVIISHNSIISPNFLGGGISITCRLCNATEKGMFTANQVIGNNLSGIGQILVQSDHNLIEGNILTDSTSTQIIEVDGSDNEILGNTIVTGTHVSTSTVSSVSGIELTCAYNTSGDPVGFGGNLVSHNLIDGAPNIGIYVSSAINSCTDNSIISNTIKNVQTAGGTQYGRGIDVGLISRILINGNNVIDNQATHTMTYGYFLSSGASGSFLNNLTNGSGNFLTAVYATSGFTFTQAFGNPGLANTVADSFTAPSINSVGYNVASLAISGTAPTIASGFGTAPSIPHANGTAAFTINVGTGGTATTGTLTMPAATNGWVVKCQDLTTQNSTVDDTKQIGAGTTTSVEIGNFTDTGAAGAWVASDILACTAMAY